MNNIRGVFFCIFCLLAIKISFSQNENKIWHFGDHAGLDFNSGSPIALTGGAIFTNEGCSSIADNAGNLLFYTDGITVWNRVHAVMPNGFGLMGDPSTTQSSMIVPIPGSSTRYYIFTIDELGQSMRYSIVDMTLAGTFGDVTATKNVLLHPNVSEKQAAVQRCDGNIWIVSHQSNTNTFYADLVTPSGISPTISSSVGTSHAGGGSGTYNTVGQLKISQQGDRIALAVRDAALYEVFNFDINTGIVSNPIAIGVGMYSVAYGVEFSPDGTKLYGGRITTSLVYQFNLMAGTAAAITASATIVGSTGNFTNSFQLGVDGKIYIAKSISQTAGLGFVDVINNPNALGTACSYAAAGVGLGGKLCLLGLPGMMVRNPLGVPSVAISGTSTICTGQSTTLTASGASTYSWSGGTSSTSASVTVAPSSTTTYYLIGTSGCGTDTDSITIVVDTLVNISASPSDSICSGQTINLSAFGSASYVWSGGFSSTSPSIAVSPISNTTYYVSGSGNICGSDTDTVTIYVANYPNMNVTGVTNICSGASTILTGTGSTSYVWSGAATATTISITLSPLVTSIYFVTSAANFCGSDVDTITVIVDTLITISAFGNDSICSGESVTLNCVGSPSYFWSGGVTSTSSSVVVSPVVTTSYYVMGAGNACGVDKDTLLVYVEAPLNISVSGETVLCIGDSTTLTASGAIAYYWSGAISSSSASITVFPAVTSVYYVSASGVHCPDDVDTIVVSVTDFSPANFSYIFDECKHQIFFQNLSDGAQSYFWNLGNGSVSSFENPTDIYVDGVYGLTFITNPGLQCADSVFQLISVVTPPEQVLLIPNVFTPNGDNENDKFIISRFANCYTYQLTIYNRWGQKVFETDVPENIYWDGTSSETREKNAGVYYYILSISNVDNEKSTLAGFVNLIK